MQLAVVLHFLTLLTAVAADGGNYYSVCYFPNWSPKKKMAEARLQVEQVNANLCSHLIYAFAMINENDIGIYNTEPDDLGKNGNYAKFNRLKKGRPKLSTMLSIGGQKNAEKGFIAAAKSTLSRRTFAHNAIRFVREKGFDGIDIDWEFPDAGNRDKFTYLLKELWLEIHDEAEKSKRGRLLLSAAVGVGAIHMKESYNTPEIVKYVDFLNVMAYDFHGSWNKITGFKSPLFSRSNDIRFSAELSQKWAVDRWINDGAPPSKIVLGLTASGNTYVLTNETDHGVGASVDGPGTSGPYTLEKGHLSYFEICERLQKEKHRWTCVWDDTQKVPFAYGDGEWVGFDNRKSIQLKTQWMMNNSLGGVMIWSLDLDDFGDTCKQGKFPLTSAMRLTIDAEVKIEKPTTPKRKRPNVIIIGFNGAPQHHTVHLLSLLLGFSLCHLTCHF